MLASYSAEMCLFHFGQKGIKTKPGPRGGLRIKWVSAGQGNLQKQGLLPCTFTITLEVGILGPLITDKEPEAQKMYVTH